MNLEEKLISLETKIAYLENFTGELNQVILDQAKTIKKISAQNEEIKKMIEEKKESLPENERPPHY